MKILHVIPWYKPAYIYGGPIESVSRLCESLVASGHQADVFTTLANGKSELNLAPGKPVFVDGVTVYYFNRITKDNTHLSPRLWRKLYKGCRDYDIVHIHSWWNILVLGAMLICRMRNVKVVFSPRGMLSDYIINGTNRFLKKSIHYLYGKSILSTTTFHATSQAEYDECKKLIPGWNGFMVPNILSLPPIVIRKKSNESFTLLFMSRIHPKKGLQFLIEAIAQLPFSVCLHIAGSGDKRYVEELKQKAILLSVANQIDWIGWIDRSEKFEVMMQADLFVLTSYNENFANTIIESLHVGTPVLISEQVGLAPFVKQEGLGWVTELNIAAIVEAIQSAHTDDAYRKRIASEGPQLVHKFFAVEKLINDYISEYSKLI